MATLPALLPQETIDSTNQTFGFNRSGAKTADITALREALIQRGGAPEDTEILEQSWGTREIYLTDPDGNRLRFGQRE